MSECPTPETIRNIMTGAGSDEAAERFAAHLAACASCLALVEGTQLDSPILQLLQRQTFQTLPVVKFEVLDNKLSELSWTLSGGPDSCLTGGFPGKSKRSRTLPPIPPPERLGPYVLQDLLGIGGVGMVYRARDTVLERTVALKLLRHDREQNSRTRDRFLREARAMAAVRHDHIVTIFQVGEAAAANGEPISFLAMELLEGENLYDWMNHSPRPSLASVLRIGRQASAGLAAAHAEGLIHRDVKPANLFLEAPASWRSQFADQRAPLGEVARVKLLDFGLAQPLKGDGIQAEEALFGTAGYMAPEQLRGEELDGRCDLFGLGCVLYELCTGAHPFPKRRRHKRKQADTELLVPVRELNPAVPLEPARLIERMLNAEPAERPESARWVERKLAEFEADLSQDDTKAMHAAATIADPAGPGEAPPRGRRRRFAILGGIAAAVIGIGLAAERFFFSHPPLTKSAVTADKDSGGSNSTNGEVFRLPAWFAGPPDAEWCGRVANSPPNVQVAYVLEKLKELNPRFDGTSYREVIGVNAMELHIVTDEVRDIRPIAALRGLTKLVAAGSAFGKGKLADITPLAGLQPNVLFLHSNPDLNDFEAVKGMKGLTHLEAGETKIGSLDCLPLSLRALTISRSQVRDLAPLRRMAGLTTFNCEGCAVRSLEPLADLPIETLRCDYVGHRDEAVIRRMVRLQSVNNTPVRNLLKRPVPQ